MNIRDGDYEGYIKVCLLYYVIERVQGDYVYFVRYVLGVFCFECVTCCLCYCEIIFVVVLFVIVEDWK